MFNSLPVTLTYPSPFRRSSNNRVQGGTVSCKWAPVLSLDDRGKGWTIYQQRETFTRDGTSNSISSRGSGCGVGMCLEGTNAHLGPCDPSEIQGLPRSTTQRLVLVLMAYFYLICSKETLNIPRYAEEFKLFSVMKNKNVHAQNCKTLSKGVKMYLNGINRKVNNSFHPGTPPPSYWQLHLGPCQFTHLEGAQKRAAWLWNTYRCRTSPWADFVFGSIAERLHMTSYL